MSQLSLISSLLGFEAQDPSRQVPSGTFSDSVMSGRSSTLSALAYYNSRQTGNAFVTAYQVYGPNVSTSTDFPVGLI